MLTIFPVSARARQLNHRLRGRKAAIISRRESEADTKLPILRSQSSPPPTDDTNGLNTKPNGISGVSQSPPMGFTAVNTRQSLPAESKPDASPDLATTTAAAQLLFSNANTENVTIINGTSIKGASPTTRAELMKKFFSSADRDARTEEEQRRSSTGITRSTAAQAPSTRPKPRSESLDTAGIYNLNSPAAVAIPSTPASLLPHSKPSQIERDDGGPYKAEMVNRMESLHRGERILPPCDRCRRLHMDCLKNLTACMGCTKKHAKCSWKDVREEELRDGRSAQITDSPNNGHSGIDVDLSENAVDDISSVHQTPIVESAAMHDEVRRTAPPIQVHAEERVEIPTPPAEVKASPIGQQLQETAIVRITPNTRSCRQFGRASSRTTPTKETGCKHWPPKSIGLRRRTTPDESQATTHFPSRPLYLDQLSACSINWTCHLRTYSRRKGYGIVIHSSVHLSGGFHVINQHFSTCTCRLRHFQGTTCRYCFLQTATHTPPPE
jgi:hypothetical protein